MSIHRNAGVFALVGALSVVSAAAGEDFTRIDPVIEFRQKMPAEIDADEPFPVEILVRNTGKAAAEAVTVTDMMGVDVTFVDADPSPAKVAGRLSWAIGKLGPGESQVIKLRLKAAATADPRLLHSIEVAYQGRAQNAAEGRVRQLALELEIAPPEPTPIGTPVPVRITITNPGSTPAREVALQSLLPEGLTHRAGQDLQNEIGTIEPGQSRTLNLTIVPKQVGDFNIQFKLRAKSAKTVESTVRVRGTPDLLTLTVAAPPAITANKSVQFELVVGNDGSAVRKSSELVVTLPKELIFLRATDRGVYDPVARTLKWDLGPIAPGEKRWVVWDGLIKEPGKLTIATNLKSAGKEQRDVQTPLTATATDAANKGGDR
jgi:Domain of unknown function DUF11/Transglutaminase family, C-terminal ig like domain